MHFSLTLSLLLCSAKGSNSGCTFDGGRQVDTCGPGVLSHHSVSFASQPTGVWYSLQRFHQGASDGAECVSFKDSQSREL